MKIVMKILLYQEILENPLPDDIGLVNEENLEQADKNSDTIWK